MATTQRPLFYILDERGEPVVEPSTAKWGAWMETANRQVAVDDLEGASVSTVFLGLDQNFQWTGPPTLFETRVFGGPHDGDQDRHATRAEALAAHQQLVAQLRAETLALPAHEETW